MSITCYIPKTTLNNFKASAPSENEIVKGNTDIVVDDFAMTFWGVIVTEHFHRANDVDTRSICGYEDNTLLSVMVFVVRVALAHHKMDLCPWISCTADPPEKVLGKSIHIIQATHFIPFVTIDHNLIPFLPDGCANVGGIRGCDLVKNMSKTF